MKDEYRRPVAAEGGLRLHLNENTAGCSPRVLEAIRALTAEEMAFYPEYDAVVRETAAHLGVPPDWLLLTNGLDEGILAAAVVALQRTPAGDAAEAVVVLPAFEMYAISTRACGGRVVSVQPGPDFSFPIDETIAAITPATRAIFVTSPNNPTGVRVSNDDIRALAGAVPTEALVFVDEAYHDFCGDTFLPHLSACPNVVVGRTFAKAYGLAALRAGCVLGQPHALASFRRVVPPYSLNVCAAAGLRAALADSGRLDWYVAQSRESRELLYEFCRRRNLIFWESGANFVLVRVGDRSGEVVERLAARGVFVRDRSSDAGCQGTVRITAGVVDHTRACLAALEEVL
jgi:histidinol-phosphate aminotransferase